MRIHRSTLILATVVATASLASPAVAASPDATGTSSSGTTLFYNTSAPIEIAGEPGGVLIEAMRFTDQDGTRRTRVIVEAYAGQAECATDPAASTARLVRTRDGVHVEAAVTGWCSDGTTFDADVTAVWRMGDVVGHDSYETLPRPSTPPCLVDVVARAATATGQLTWHGESGTTTVDEFGDAGSAVTRWHCPAR